MLRYGVSRESVRYSFFIRKNKRAKRERPKKSVSIPMSYVCQESDMSIHAFINIVDTKWAIRIKASSGLNDWTVRGVNSLGEKGIVSFREGIWRSSSLFLTC